MSDGIWSAASGAIGQVTALDVAADNVANATTPGFHGNRAVFREVLTQAVRKRAGGFDLEYSVAATPAADLSQGPIVVTGRPLDVAIRGDAYLVVKTPQGERYTRAGSLRVDEQGTLLTAGGDPVVGADRRPIQVPAQQSLSIDADGTVRAGPDTAGQLLLVEFDNPRALTREGHFLLRGEAAAGKPKASNATLETGAIEGSNTSPVRGMVDIVNATRAFEICERAIDAFRDADRKAAVDIMTVK
jgi:flagellar basal-body rod protein FlgF